MSWMGEEVVDLLLTMEVLCNIAAPFACVAELHGLKHFLTKLLVWQAFDPRLKQTRRQPGNLEKTAYVQL